MSRYLGQVRMYIALSFFAACLYGWGSLGLKKALGRGATAAKVTAISNITMMFWSLPLVFFFPGTSNSHGWMGAMLAGFFLFWGRFFMIRALQAGDLSLVAPVLATKTILVAVFTWISGTGTISERLIIAAALASCGMALLQWVAPGDSFHMRIKPLLLAMTASVLFAGTDVAVQGTARLLGLGWFQPAMFLTVALLTPLLGKLEVPPRDALKPLYAGSVVVSFQTSLMILLIGLSGQATLLNIVYSSRSLLSVVADWWGVEKSERKSLPLRFAGALLLTAAVVIAVTK